MPYFRRVSFPDLLQAICSISCMPCIANAPSSQANLVSWLDCCTVKQGVEPWMQATAEGPSTIKTTMTTAMVTSAPPLSSGLHAPEMATVAMRRQRLHTGHHTGAVLGLELILFAVHGAGFLGDYRSPRHLAVVQGGCLSQLLLTLRVCKCMTCVMCMSRLWH